MVRSLKSSERITNSLKNIHSGLQTHDLKSINQCMLEDLKVSQALKTNYYVCNHSLDLLWNCEILAFSFEISLLTVCLHDVCLSEISLQFFINLFQPRDTLLPHISTIHFRTSTLVNIYKYISLFIIRFRIVYEYFYSIFWANKHWMEFWKLFRFQDVIFVVCGTYRRFFFFISYSVLESSLN